MSYHRERCRHKRRYRCHDDALAGLAEIRGRKPEKAEGLSAYRCPFCNRGWHLGHTPSMEALESMAREIRGLDSRGRPVDAASRNGNGGRSDDGGHPATRVSPDTLRAGERN